MAEDTEHQAFLEGRNSADCPVEVAWQAYLKRHPRQPKPETDDEQDAKRRRHYA